MRRTLGIAAVLALVAALVIGLTQAGGKRQEGTTAETSFDLGAAKRKLAGAPAPLAALHEQSNALLGGGRKAFDTRLRALRGHPVVVNKWASWCVPCRTEFPLFEQVATDRGKEIAFVGLNVRDKDPAARRFLGRRPLPYPSYTDPDEHIGRALKTPQLYPVTLFIDERGRTAFMHIGEYRTVKDLNADIDRYLGA